MNRRPLIFVTAIVAALACRASHAQLSMTWTTIDGGGGTCSAGSLVLSCTIGQPDAGPVMAGGALSLTGGFWTGVAATGPHCGSADFNCDGDIGTDADIEAFFRVLAGGTC